jgi:hypothetical protein
MGSLEDKDRELLKLGDKNNYYTINYDLILFSYASRSTKGRMLRINSLEAHSTKMYPLNVISNQSNKKTRLKIKISYFSKTPMKIVTKENDVAIPFILNKQKLWLRIKLSK